MIGFCFSRRLLNLHTKVNHFVFLLSHALWTFSCYLCWIWFCEEQLMSVFLCKKQSWLENNFSFSLQLSIIWYLREATLVSGDCLVWSRSRASHNWSKTRILLGWERTTRYCLDKSLNIPVFLLININIAKP